jgi:hypothetical protein
MPPLASNQEYVRIRVNLEFVISLDTRVQEMSEVRHHAAIL